MSGRPRPVTATVTKPLWMQVPNPATIRKIRRRSLESSGSTASLTSLLEHSSYDSASEDEIYSERVIPMAYDSDNSDRAKQQRQTTFIKSSSNSRSPSPGKSSRSENNLSAWEKWVIEKAKEEQKKKIEDNRKKEEEKRVKEKLEQEKRIKNLKGLVLQQSWTEKKHQELMLQKKLEKMRIQNEKRKKAEIDQQIRQKATEKFAEWQDNKRREEKERRRKKKEEEQHRQQEEARRKQLAEQKFQEWLKEAHKRPKSAPNSFGYLSGKMTGYHDRSAYPQPSFFNPIPWQPPAIPTVLQKTEKTHRSKPKIYKWNPDKYF
ncbi:unnamed protein product [Lymnaea stagnalis]|uniref:Coiled-coil domain-containing protein n=1 Tax=Lymnaea stagnalis TaxID=6523 RepID=A0AAV2I5U1_LYMST